MLLSLIQSLWIHLLQPQTHQFADVVQPGLCELLGTEKYHFNLIKTIHFKNIFQSRTSRESAVLRGGSMQRDPPRAPSMTAENWFNCFTFTHFTTANVEFHRYHKSPGMQLWTINESFYFWRKQILSLQFFYVTSHSFTSILPYLPYRTSVPTILSLPFSYRTWVGSFNLMRRSQQNWEKCCS